MLGRYARALLTVLLCAGAAAAAPLIVMGSQGSLAASAVFEVVNFSNLGITLTNTSTADVTAPSQLLTAVFFDLADNPTLTPVWAVLAPGSTVLFGSAGPGGVLGGEWAYATGLAGAPGGALQGVSSVGLGLFGPHDLFPGANLAGPVSPDGHQFGITSAGDDPAMGNWAVTGQDPLIQNAVIFTLSGLPDGFQLSGVSNVSFFYGSSLTDSRVTLHNPEPGSAVLALIGLTLLLGGTLRRKLSKRFR